MPSGARAARASSSRSSLLVVPCCGGGVFKAERAPGARRTSSRDCSSALRQRHTRCFTSSSRAGTALARRRKASKRREGRRRGAEDRGGPGRARREEGERGESRAKKKADRSRFRAERERWKTQRDLLKQLKHQLRGDLDESFDFISGVSLEISGRRLARLAHLPGLTITEDVPVRLSSTADGYIWPAAAGILPLLGTTSNRPRRRRRSRSSTRGSRRTGPTSARLPRDRADSDHDARAELSRRRPRSRNVRGGHRCGQCPRPAGAVADLSDLDVDVMDDSGHGAHERRHRRRPSGSTRTGRARTSASRTSRSTRRGRATSRRTRWTRRSRSCGSAASWSSRRRATTASRTGRAASSSPLATIRS